MSGNPDEIENGGTAGTPETVVAEGISEVGQAALDEVKARFTDTTVDESIIGFGDTFCDWRAPLAQVAIVKAAEEAAAEAAAEAAEEAANAEEGEDAASLKEAAKGMHEPTPGKLEKLKKFYSELYPTENAEGGSTTPAEGGSTTPPAEGGSTTPPAEGGSTTPPAEGDQSGSGSTTQP